MLFFLLFNFVQISVAFHSSFYAYSPVESSSNFREVTFSCCCCCCCCCYCYFSFQVEESGQTKRRKRTKKNNKDRTCVSYRPNEGYVCKLIYVNVVRRHTDCSRDGTLRNKRKGRGRVSKERSSNC